MVQNCLNEFVQGDMANLAFRSNRTASSWRITSFSGAKKGIVNLRGSSSLINAILLQLYATYPFRKWVLQADDEEAQPDWLRRAQDGQLVDINVLHQI
jgi:hypothetical protein